MLLADQEESERCYTTCRRRLEGISKFVGQALTNDSADNGCDYTDNALEKSCLHLLHQNHNNSDHHLQSHLQLSGHVHSQAVSRSEEQQATPDCSRKGWAKKFLNVH